ncbi:tryptophan halogenase family protein [Marinimicrobium alkaliphilum]|uniref:tryptophan halogenase family protein n=1 Tax=Marinimicrobium alkaliphilum TaxID=2202654 RepID=UPI000DB96B69|nr:tryptophan halogenase family protein [Marinimicrobium alkaliphilum]
MTAAIERLVILGGGTAGWMTAAALSRLLPPDIKIRLVESEQIGTVGVGEATIPHLRQFNTLLGIDENAFVQATGATYKLAIEFNGWGDAGSRYLHPFSGFGDDLNGIDFHHYFLRARKHRPDLTLDDFSLASWAARSGRFGPPRPEFPTGYGYAFHLDAGRYARFLRDYAEARGVERIEGRVAQVEQDPDSGHIRRLHLESGQAVEGQLFVDCSGFRALLIGDTLGVGYQSWRHWLPCNRAVALGSPAMAEPPPYTRVTASGAGWIWRIPLQHRTGNGHVYSSDHLSDEQACEQLRIAIGKPAITEPNFIRFEPGYRARSWDKNCVAVGLSSGFLEPLESTSIYLIQMAILKLVTYFPNARCEGPGQDAFNRWMALEYGRVRDFLILHYHANRRPEAFWQQCREMTIPDELARKLALFKEAAAVEHYEHGLFGLPSWLAVYLGQGVTPDGCDPRVAGHPPHKVAAHLQGMADTLKRCAESLPPHAEAVVRGVTGSPAPAELSLYGGRYGR